MAVSGGDGPLIDPAAGAGALLIPPLRRFVEAADDPDEGRKAALAEWAESQGLDPAACRYLSAFVSRTVPPFRQLVSSLAWGTHVWFLDEPDHVMRLEEFPERVHP